MIEERFCIEAARRVRDAILKDLETHYSLSLGQELREKIDDGWLAKAMDDDSRLGPHPSEGSLFIGVDVCRKGCFIGRKVTISPEVLRFSRYLDDMIGNMASTMARELLADTKADQ